MPFGVVMALPSSLPEAPDRVVAYACLAELLLRGDDFSGVLVALGSSAPVSPVWAAAASADEELLAELLREDGPQVCRVQLNERDPNSGCFPLICAARLRALDAISTMLQARADVNVQDADLFGFGASGFRLLPECGGKTALHHLVAGRVNDDIFRACSCLLEARADVDLVDSLGLTAHDIAVSAGNMRVGELLLEAGGAVPSERVVSQAEIAQLCREREGEWQDQVEGERRRQRLRAINHIRTSYVAAHASLYEAEFLAAAASKGLAEKRSAGVSVLAELSPGVFAIDDFLTPSLCSMLLDELDSFAAWADETGLAVARPNSMNRYGMVLNDIGFQASMHAIMEQIVCALVDLAPPISTRFGDSPRSRFLSQHSFVVKYNVGEDEDLKTHRDDSDVTLNLCLGRSFEGADVYFHAQPPASASAVCCQGSEDEYVYPHPADCQYCTFRHRHVPGTAILHLGQHVHGVDRLQSGERISLIMWCRRRPYSKEASFVPWPDAENAGETDIPGQATNLSSSLHELPCAADSRDD